MILELIFFRCQMSFQKEKSKHQGCQTCLTELKITLFTVGLE